MLYRRTWAARAALATESRSARLPRSAPSESSTTKPPGSPESFTASMSLAPRRRGGCRRGRRRARASVRRIAVPVRGEAHPQVGRAVELRSASGWRSSRGTGERPRGAERLAQGAAPHAAARVDREHDAQLARRAAPTGATRSPRTGLPFSVTCTAERRAGALRQREHERALGEAGAGGRRQRG